MSRLQMVPIETQDPALRAMFDEVCARGIAVPNLYRVLGNAPPMLRAWLDFAWPLRLHAQTSRRIRELLIVRGAQVSGARYEWVHPVEMALAAGVPQARPARGRIEVAAAHDPVLDLAEEERERNRHFLSPPPLEQTRN